MAADDETSASDKIRLAKFSEPTTFDWKRISEISELEGTEVMKNPGKILFNFESYLYILLDYFRDYFSFLKLI